MRSTEEHVITTVGSWWNNSISSEDDCKAKEDKVVPAKPTMQAVGGARAQSRFSGKSAKPIFSSPPLSGAPVVCTSHHAALSPHQPAYEDLGRTPLGDYQPPVRGNTCDGTLPDPSAPASRWVFNVEAWRWEMVAEQQEGQTALSSNNNLEHMIAARRWGDSRDGLASVLGSSVARIDPRAPKRRALASGIVGGGVGAADPAEGGFASVGGMASQKELLKTTVIYPLTRPEIYKHLGVPANRGVLLYGPPGCGKTHLAWALAAEACVHLEVVDGAACVGNAAAEERLRRAFSAAKASAPCVLFLDEIDAMAPSRTATSTSDVERQSTALVLSLLDALHRSGAAVAVIAATGRRDAVDAALRRPGRLDCELALGPPRSEDREAILRCAATGVVISKDVDLCAVAGQLHGFMAADVAGVVTEAALECAAAAVRKYYDSEYENGNENAELNHTSSCHPSSLSSSPAVCPPDVQVENVHFQAAIRRLGPSVLRGLGPMAEAPQDVGWEDVGGLEKVKRELQEAVQWPLMHGARLAAYGLPAASGALLYGPPGCGKTLLARAVASRCGANFLSVRGPELLQKWVGESERAVRDVFDASRAAAPCVLFLDEVDALATRRSAGGGGGGAAAGEAAAARVLNQILCELDGVGAKSGTAGVFVLAATNRPAAVDPALLRPGRLGAILKVPLPDATARENILRRALRRCPLANDIDLTATAASEQMEGMSGADVAEVARRAGTALVREAIVASQAALESSKSDDDISLGGGGPLPSISGFSSLGSIPSSSSPNAPLHELRVDHLEAALQGVRKSVSAEQAAYFDNAEAALLEGGLEEPGAAQKRAADAVAQVLHAASGKREAALQARVAQLEAALAAAGVQVPDNLVVKEERVSEEVEEVQTENADTDNTANDDAMME